MKVIICGAGIAGLALAQRLDRLGMDVTVLEKSAGPRGEGYMIDFFGPGYDAVDAMGMLPRIEQLGYHLREVTYHDATGRTRARMRGSRVADTWVGRTCAQ